ncbi:MAG: site-specific integrase, partial [Alphaproteobacteria bacterium]|nr:site-specific integrase [Alphaproteobacteria bacterium]
ASRFREIGQRAGTSFRCHDLRHEFAIRELESGRDIYDLSRHLGHSSVKTTELYLDYVDRSGAQTRAQKRRFSREGGTNGTAK